MTNTIFKKTHKFMEGRPFFGLSFRIFVLILSLFFIVLTPCINASAMSDIAGGNIYDLFSDVGDDSFGSATLIVEDLSAQVFQLVKYIGVFVFVVSLIVAAVGLTRARAAERDKAKTKMVVAVAGAVCMFASLGVITFAGTLADNIAAGIIKSEYRSLLEGNNSATITNDDYRAIKGVATNPASIGLEPDSYGYFDRNDIRNCLVNSGCIRSALQGNERDKALKYGEACVLLYSGTHIILINKQPVTDWKYDSSSNTSTGLYYIVDFSRGTITPKY